ncbi:unnamed protein product [Symbiodinium microadriaticum]|nr:unnamed protein product [Symbiodinium microadriaticum]
MAKRRGVSEVVVPELPDEPLRDILQVPDRRNARGRMRQPDEWKGYALPGGGIVTVPLDGPVALEEFEQLDPKTRYMLLQRAQEAWFGESRVKSVEAKDDMGAFVNVQLEMFLRHIRTNKELEKVKRSMAEQTSRPAGSSFGTNSGAVVAIWPKAKSTGPRASCSEHRPSRLQSRCRCLKRPGSPDFCFRKLVQRFSGGLMERTRNAWSHF